MKKPKQCSDDSKAEAAAWVFMWNFLIYCMGIGVFFIVLKTLRSMPVLLSTPDTIQYIVASIFMALAVKVLKSYLK